MLRRCLYILFAIHCSLHSGCSDAGPLRVSPAGVTAAPGGEVTLKLSGPVGKSPPAVHSSDTAVATIEVTAKRILVRAVS
ncbi:MAG: hypothetical protein LBC18_15450, partial [Opitutaceae bacterium]|nr:hypothetical protein [Opitutaceae bacterium]